MWRMVRGRLRRGGMLWSARPTAWQKAWAPTTHGCFESGPHIVADRGLTDVLGAASRAARAAFLQDELLASKGATIHGARIAPSKWMSLHKAWSEWDAEVTLRGALILGTLANEKVHQSDCRHCLPFDTLLRIAHGRFVPSVD